MLELKPLGFDGIFTKFFYKDIKIFHYSGSCESNF